MGHVPAGPLPQERASAHLPRRERRGSRTPGDGAAYRRRVGRRGESLAASFLARRGFDIIARNLRVGRAEIDLVARDRTGVIAVEVKYGVQAIEHFTPDKRATLLRAMRISQIHFRRLDLITVTPHVTGATISWYRDA